MFKLAQSESDTCTIYKMAAASCSFWQFVNINKTEREKKINDQQIESYNN